MSKKLFCLALLLRFGQSPVSSGVKPVYEDHQERGRNKLPSFSVDWGHLNAANPVKASTLGYVRSTLPRPPTRETKPPRGIEKKRKLTDDRARRQYPHWETEPISNGIDNDRFPSFGDNIPPKVRPYKTPGEWATPAPESGIDLGFTPVQTYIQVRNTNKVEHLPQSEALKEASSLDEVLNAHRLKEVLRTKKIQEVYSEEGYEDSAYDHGDHERHAEHDEGYTKAKDGKYKVKDPVQHVQDIADAESMVVEKSNEPKAMKPKVQRKRVEATSMKFAYMDDKEKTMKMKVEVEPSTLSPAEQNTTPRIQGRKQKRAHITNNQIKRQQPQQKVEVQKPPPKREFVTPNGDFWSLPNVFEELSKPGKWNANFQPKAVKNEKELPPKIGPNHVRIPPIPTYGYIHMLTDAYYGTQAPMAQHLPKPIPSHVINLTEALRPQHKQRYTGFEPRKIGKRAKREDDDEVDKEKNDSEEYEKDLSKELDQQEKKIIGEALRNIKVENYVSGRKPPPRPFSLKPTVPPYWRNTFDSYKYPYFNAKNINPYSPLRYASHPSEFPRKSGNAMEFYDSRDREVQCDPVSVDLDSIPKSNSTKYLGKQPGKEKRIIALGDKIQCLKIKYFGEDPLDNPFFKEDELKEAMMVRPRLDDDLKYHSTYEYKPNRTMDVLVKARPAESVNNNTIAIYLNDSNVEGTEEKANFQNVKPPLTVNETQNYRVIPVSETYENIQMTTASPIKGMKPPPLHPRSLPFSVIRLPPRPKSRNTKRKIHYRHNCIHPITKMTITERSDDDHEVIFDCRDATFIETIRQGMKHIKIIPKLRRSDLIDALLDESDHLRAGEVIEGNSIVLKRRKRATPSPIQRKKSNLFPNKSVLDRIIKKPTAGKKGNINKDPSVIDLGDRSPEEIDLKSLTTAASLIITTTPKPTITTTTQTTTTVTTTTQATRKMEAKPLSRLSGRDFLDRYHKSKGVKVNVKSNKKEFWKVPEKKLMESSPSVLTEEKGIDPSNNHDASPTPVLLYIVDEATGRGHWVPEQTTDSATQVVETVTKPSVPVSDRQQKKQDVRKKFFAKKLKKVL